MCQVSYIGISNFQDTWKVLVLKKIFRFHMYRGISIHPQTQKFIAKKIVQLLEMDGFMRIDWWEATTNYILRVTMVAISGTVFGGDGCFLTFSSTKKPI